MKPIDKEIELLTLQIKKLELEKDVLLMQQNSSLHMCPPCLRRHYPSYPHPYEPYYFHYDVPFVTSTTWTVINNDLQCLAQN